MGEPSPLQVDVSASRYQAMIGVGGIGSGTFFALSGNHTLGREESRGGRFLDRRDYCKLHIVSHYVKTLLGPDFCTIPIGLVGDDEVGRRLVDEMVDAGLEMSYVKRSSGDQTLFSFCFVYPDAGGGNLTTDDSACGKVDAVYVALAEPEFARYTACGLALAVPEVPLEAREKLLQLGTQYGFYRVASFAAEEVSAAIDMGMLQRTDLLALNVDEAAAAAGLSLDTLPESNYAFEAAKTAVEGLRGKNPDLLISITAGKNGSWSWDGEELVHVPAFQAEVVSTAGAGDAHLAGIIAGLVAGLTLPQAQELGTLVAAHSVTSPHTIDKRINRRTLQSFADKSQAPICDVVKTLLVSQRVQRTSFLP
jgi:sugar/nucleoside kinase (ribokinase family)